MKEENRMAILTWLLCVVGSFEFAGYFPYNWLFWIPNLLFWLKVLKRSYPNDLR